jgi:hypothetical protein
MPKIPPRREITDDPLYQTTMAAQHLAYQLMRDMPPDHKAEAARLHMSTVHATTYATSALEEGRSDRADSYRAMARSAEEAKKQLAPLASLATDARDLETLTKKLDEIAKAAETALLSVA